MSDSKELRTMRYMAWERAQAEMKAALQTFWSCEERDERQHMRARTAVETFIKEVNEKGLME